MDQHAAIAVLPSDQPTCLVLPAAPMSSSDPQLLTAEPEAASESSQCNSLHFINTVFGTIIGGTSWGANSEVLRTTALSLMYSVAEYCSPVWLGSAHINRLHIGHGRCASYKHTRSCGWSDSPNCACGAKVQTMWHILAECPITRYPGPPEDLIILTDEAHKWLISLGSVVVSPVLY